MRKALWLKHDAHFGEHPKTLRLRRLAGRHADSAECGWWRIVEGAKRYGEWTFDSEDHIAHVAGAYARFLPLYREVGFLDDLTIHNATEYQAPLSGAERVARHRERNAHDVTPGVTDVTPREEKRREEREEQTAPDPADVYWTVTGKYPTTKTLTWIDDLSGQFGAEAVARAIPVAHRADPSVASLLGRVADDLRRTSRQLDRAEREAEQAKVAEQRRVNVPLLRARHNNGQHIGSPDDACPECRGAA